MNIAVPSIIIKMMRQRFDQQWSVRKTESTAGEQGRILDLIRPSKVSLDARLEGPTLRMEDLLRLEEGDVLSFDYPTHRTVDCKVNGRFKFRGRIGSTGRKLAFYVEECAPSAPASPDLAPGHHPT
jgi:flagellar motor switch protein FliM